jgi:hypothetical protein
LKSNGETLKSSVSDVAVLNRKPDTSRRKNKICKRLINGKSVSKPQIDNV